MVAAGVQVVALAHLVGEVAVVVVGIDVAHETLFLVALRAGDLLWVPSRQLAGLKLITIICVHLSVLSF